MKTEIQGFCITAAVISGVFAAIVFLSYLPLPLDVVLSWALEFPVHFPLQEALIAAVLAVYFIRRRPKLFWLCLLAAIVLGMNFLTVVWPTSTPASEAEGFRVLSANVHTLNRNMEAVAESIAEQNADIVAVLEVNDAWVKFLGQKFRKQYPYRFELPRRDNFGIALYSRKEFSKVGDSYFGASPIPSIEAVVEISQKAVRIIATHPLPPVSVTGWKLRTQQINGLGDYLKQTLEPSIAIGDFNVSPWAPVYREFLRRGEVKNAAQGFGFVPTWGFRIGVFHTAIDHAFYRGALKVQGFHSFQLPGSDHRGIFAEFSFLND